MFLRKYLVLILISVAGLSIYSNFHKNPKDHNETVQMLVPQPAVSRETMQNQLKTQTFDVLVIGGGAIGAGTAVDAANRGLKVALVERFDFGSGTSSKSTKLAHGGVRYLEKAVFNLDRQQYDLVTEALAERGHLFQMAPHLVKPLEIITPIYNWWEVPYYWIGLKCYDWIAGSANIHKSEYVLSSTVVEKIPHIRAEGMKGGVAYYDGQFNDTRLNISLIISSVALGATVLNYTEVVHLLRDPDSDQIIGATVQNNISNERFDIHAKVVINATGPYVDTIRRMDNQNATPLIRASSGTHLVLDKNLMPSNVGLLVPKTKDGRVIFMLPWEENVLIGTTDNATEISDQPLPDEEDVSYLLSYVNEYLHVSLKPAAIKSAWTGIRPLVQNPNAKDTASVVRDHFIEQAPSGLLTITGGKWTTFRKMAEDIVNQAAQRLATVNTQASTTQLRLIGASGYDEALAKTLASEYQVSLDIAEHLVSSYGSIAQNVLKQGKLKSLNSKLAENHPIILAEIEWALAEEMAQKPMDILARRTRLATLDARAAQAALPKVVEMMKEHFGWTSLKAAQEEQEALLELLPPLQKR